MSFVFLPLGIYFIWKAPDFLPTSLTFISTVSKSLNISFVGMSVVILSTLIATSASLNSNVRYTTFIPANAQLTPKFAKNKLLPAPLPPAKILSSPLLNPPNSFLSKLAQPVLTCPLLSLRPISLPFGSLK